MDNGDGLNSGTIRWTVLGNGFVTLTYQIPYPDC